MTVTIIVLTGPQWEAVGMSARLNLLLLGCTFEGCHSAVTVVVPMSRLHQARRQLAAGGGISNGG